MRASNDKTNATSKASKKAELKETMAELRRKNEEYGSADVLKEEYGSITFNTGNLDCIRSSPYVQRTDRHPAERPADGT